MKISIKTKILIMVLAILTCGIGMTICVHDTIKPRVAYALTLKQGSRG